MIPSPGDELTPEQLARVDDLAAEALAVPPSRREALVRERCDDDLAVAAAVLALLAHADGAEAEGFLGAPVELPPLEVTETEGSQPKPPPPDDEPPDIPGYRVIRPIAAGGMGVIWLAEQDNPRREVALKVIRPGMASREVLQRFQFESHVLGRLQHPGIAQIYEAGMHDAGSGPQPYFAMEYVQGALPLISYADAHGLSVRERLQMFAPVCDAVQHAHQKGVIHRDIKPANILVDNTGQPKILDFGIARATDSDLKVTTITKNVGSIMGTLPYMSPEQTMGDPDELDVRSDVYALGVTLYELLAGKRPYDLSNRGMLEMVRIIRVEEPTRLGTINRALRGDIDTIVSKALEKDKDRRYASAGGLADDIQRYLNDETVLARPASGWYRASKFTRRNKALVAGVVATLVALAVGTAVSTSQWFSAERAREQAEQRTAEAVAARELAARKVQEEALARREAEGNLYFQRIAAARWKWWLTDVVAAEKLLDACPAGLRAWEWRHLKWRCRSATMRIRCSRGSHTIAIAFSADGQRVIRITRRGGREQFDLRTGRLLQSEPGGKSNIGSRFAVSADLQWILSDQYRKSLELRQAGTGRIVRSTAVPDTVNVLALSADASLAARGTRDTDVVLWNPKTGIKTQGFAKPKGFVQSLAFSGDGNLLAVGTRDGSLAVWDLASRKVVSRVSCFEDSGIAHIVFSPKGALVAAVGQGKGTMTGDSILPTGDARPIKVFDVADGTLRAQMRGHSREADSLAFDATGQTLASASSDGTVRIWHVADGREESCLRDRARWSTAVAFRPDGKWLLTAGGDEVLRLWPVGTDQVATKVAMPGSDNLVFTPHAYALLTTWGTTVRMWVTGTGGRQIRSKDLGVRIGPLACLARDKKLAIGTDHGTIQIRDPADCAVLAEYAVHPGKRVSALAFSADETRAVSVGHDTDTGPKATDELTLWNAKTGRILHRLSAGMPGRFVRVAFLPNGREIAATWFAGAGGKQQTAVRIFDTATGREQRVLRTGLLVGCLAIHPGGDWMATVDRSDAIHLWDAASLLPVRTWKSKSFVRDLAFSPDGTRLVSVGSFLKLWDPQTGREVVAPDSSMVGIFQSVAFSDDGQALAAAGQQGFTAVWRAIPPPLSNQPRTRPAPPAQQAPR